MQQPKPNPYKGGNINIGDVYLMKIGNSSYVVEVQAINGQKVLYKRYKGIRDYYDSEQASMHTFKKALSKTV
jgi:hypothetical protein